MAFFCFSLFRVFSFVVRYSSLLLSRLLVCSSCTTFYVSQRRKENNRNGLHTQTSERPTNEKSCVSNYCTVQLPLFFFVHKFAFAFSSHLSLASGKQMHTQRFESLLKFMRSIVAILLATSRQLFGACEWQRFATRSVFGRFYILSFVHIWILCNVSSANWLGYGQCVIVYVPRCECVWWRLHL